MRWLRSPYGPAYGYGDWVGTGRGIPVPGYYPAALLEEGPDPSEAGSVGPAGPGVGGDLEPDAQRSRVRSPDHPLQPVPGFRGPLRCQAC